MTDFVWEINNIRENSHTKKIVQMMNQLMMVGKWELIKF